MTLVVDASAIAAILFVEPEILLIRQRLDGHVLAAPRLLHYEMASIAMKKIRRDGLDPKLAAEALNDLQTFDIIFHDVEPTDAMATSIATGLSAYDASYLWLSLELGAPLVTLDIKLAKAAG